MVVQATSDSVDQLVMPFDLWGFLWYTEDVTDDHIRGNFRFFNRLLEYYVVSSPALQLSRYSYANRAVKLSVLWCCYIVSVRNSNDPAPKTQAAILFTSVAVTGHSIAMWVVSAPVISLAFQD